MQNQIQNKKHPFSVPKPPKNGFGIFAKSNPPDNRRKKCRTREKNFFLRKKMQNKNFFAKKNPEKFDFKNFSEKSNAEHFFALFSCFLQQKKMQNQIHNTPTPLIKNTLFSKNRFFFGARSAPLTFFCFFQPSFFGFFKFLVGAIAPLAPP